MEAIDKVAALERAVAQPTRGVAPTGHELGKAAPDDLVDQFEALMRGRGESNGSSGAPARPSSAMTAIGNLADDNASIAEETDALYDTEDMSASEVAVRMSTLAQEMRLVGLQLKAYSEMSKQSREGVQTLIKS